MQVIAKPKFNHHQDEDDKGDRERRRHEKAVCTENLIRID
jgi:hypothetical protein